MATEFTAVHRVEFAETDMAGIMHFAEFFRLMERTEHAFFRSLGLSIHMESEGRVIGWPRVRAGCDFRRPLRFEDVVEVHLRVVELREKSITCEYTFRKLGGEAPEEVARGSMTAVCVEVDRAAGTMRAISIPDEVKSRLAPPSGEGD